MSNKGQTCVSCVGTCCTAVTFIGVNNPQLAKDIMDSTVNELKALGYNEIYRSHIPCVVKTKTGCSIYERRPRLCRSYYCRGKYWEPQTSIRNNKSTQSLRVN